MGNACRAGVVQCFMTVRVTCVRCGLGAGGAGGCVRLFALLDGCHRRRGCVLGTSPLISFARRACLPIAALPDSRRLFALSLSTGTSRGLCRIAPRATVMPSYLPFASGRSPFPLSVRRY
jgi:hypothetical protein